MIRAMLVASPLVQKLGIDVGKMLIQFKNGRPGRIEPVTANSTTLEGGRPTFAVLLLDETHLWVETNSGHKVFAVIKRNLGKNTGGRARFVETTNAFDPNADSVAQRTYEAVQEFVKAGVPEMCDILYDCVEAPDTADGFNLKDPNNEKLLRHWLKETYADAYWIDIDRVVSEIYDPRTPVGESWRFYLNRVQENADAWMPKAIWMSCLDDSDPIKPKDQIAIGFDGSLYDDATAICGVRLHDRKLFVLGVWEHDGSEDWEVDTAEVDAVIHKAFRDYRVAWVYADPFLWQDVIDRWAAEYGKKIVFKFPTNRERPMFEALERFHTGAHTGLLKHDGNLRLQEHVLNAVTRETRSGYILSKEKPKSKKKIDLCMAAVLAYEAAGDAINDGRMRKIRKIVTM